MKTRPIQSRGSRSSKPFSASRLASGSTSRDKPVAPSTVATTARVAFRPAGTSSSIIWPARALGGAVKTTLEPSSSLALYCWLGTTPSGSCTGSWIALPRR